MNVDDLLYKRLQLYLDNKLEGAERAIFELELAANKTLYEQYRFEIAVSDFVELRERGAELMRFETPSNPAHDLDNPVFIRNLIEKNVRKPAIEYPGRPALAVASSLTPRPGNIMAIAAAILLLIVSSVLVFYDAKRIPAEPVVILKKASAKDDTIHTVLPDKTTAKARTEKDTGEVGILAMPVAPPTPFYDDSLKKRYDSFVREMKNDAMSKHNPKVDTLYYFASPQRYLLERKYDSLARKTVPGHRFIFRSFQLRAAYYHRDSLLAIIDSGLVAFNRLHDFGAAVAKNLDAAITAYQQSRSRLSVIMSYDNLSSRSWNCVYQDGFVTSKTFGPYQTARNVYNYFVYGLHGDCAARIGREGAPVCYENPFQAERLTRQHGQIVDLQYENEQGIYQSILRKYNP